MRLMRHSDVGALDEDERRIFWQAISEAELAGAHAVERMLDADPAWAKFVRDGNPRFRREVWLEYGRILASGLRLTPDPDGGWGDGIVGDGERHLCRVRIGDEPRLYVRLPLDDAVRRAQELADGVRAIEDAQTVTDWSRGQIDVEVPLIGADHGSVAKRLHALGAEVVRPDEPEPVSCVEVLRDAGIGAPAPLALLLDGAEQVEDWYWSTDPALTSRGEEYLMSDREWLLEPVPDQLVISQGGHGVNSHALTVRLAVGRVAVHAQVAYGGAFTDPAEAAGAVTRLLHDCAALVDAGLSWNASPRGRDVAVRWSGLEGEGTVRTWDSRLRRWDRVQVGRRHAMTVAREILRPHAGA